MDEHTKETIIELLQNGESIIRASQSAKWACSQAVAKPFTMHSPAEHAG